MTKTSFYLLALLFHFARCQQLQWFLLSDGSGMDTPMPRRDAALGYDSAFLILFGGRDQSGMPTQDSYAFNILIGQWERLDFPNPPSSRYGMASANSLGNGLYLFGGFGMQGSSNNYNPYMAYGSSGLPSYRQSPAVQKKQKRSVAGKQNYMNPTGYNNPTGYSNYNNNDDRADENFYPLQDAWFLNYMTKTWQQTQISQYARGFGSAAASPFSSGGVPRVIYSMGKSRDWMYSTVESITPPTFGFKQLGMGQSAIIMYDLSSFNPSYPHARYKHSTTLLTDNHLLLYGGCLSGYGKGGPCPSTDTWLMYLDRGHWERLWECPTTKLGAAMVTLPTYDVCAAIGQGLFTFQQGMNSEPPVAVLWGGREKNPSSIRTYPSPDNEVAVFSLSQKKWYLKQAQPSATGGQFPQQREGAAYVAGCFQGMPGMFVFGGRSVNDGRLLSDLWFLQASPQGALSASNGRGCIYPFTYFHLHGLFQFFAYGVFFPIGYIVGGYPRPFAAKRKLHMALQIFGVAVSVCGFAFGVHAVRAPAWLHFKHAHAIIGIITFILTVIQLVAGLIGAFILSRQDQHERIDESSIKHRSTTYRQKESSSATTWRLAHHILGALVLALGLVNISLGVFLGVLPLAVWIIWYIYLGFLVLILLGVNLARCFMGKGGGKEKFPKPDKREEPKGTSQTSLKYADEPTMVRPTVQPRNMSRPPPLETTIRDINRNPRPIDDMAAPLLPGQRQSRPGDVMGSGNLPQYPRPNEREYPGSTRKRSGPSESGGFDYYVGYPPEHENNMSRPPVQQQNEHNLTRVRLQ